ncbi:hypothetical protein [Salinibacter ruber]|uniref:Uncharacterized protein n=1 Tax=Salinibacter ruber TaxID=146919 RepID=A0A9X2UBD1_9BACT|nr:hypothetical protein [Salinibacter ruber]MCS3953189.1 hypothetical protein [Salinibacter ruber]
MALVRDAAERLVYVLPLGAVVDDMGRVIDRINAHFGTDFDRFEHTPDAVAEVHAGRGYHAGPSEQRDQLKADTRADFDAQLQADPALRHTLEEANALHDALTRKREAEYR